MDGKAVEFASSGEGVRLPSRGAELVELDSTDLSLVAGGEDMWLLPNPGLRPIGIISIPK